MKLIALVNTIKIDLDVSKLSTNIPPFGELHANPEAFEYHLTCLELKNALKALCGLSEDTTNAEFDQRLQDPQLAEEELTTQHIDRIRAVIEVHMDRTNRTNCDWNIKNASKAHLLAKAIAEKLDSFYSKTPPKKPFQHGWLGMLRSDLAKGISNDTVALLKNEATKPWHWLLSRKGQVIDVKKCFMQKLNGDPMVCVDNKTLLTEEEYQWVCHHSSLIEHLLLFNDNLEVTRKQINNAFAGDSYEVRNIYGAEGIERLSANCMMAVLQKILDKNKFNNNDAINVLSLLCGKQEIEKVTLQDIQCSHAKMQQFFPDMMSFERYARLVIKCLVENYVHRFSQLLKLMSTDRKEFPKEFKIAKVLQHLFNGDAPFDEFYSHLERNKIAEDRFASDDEGKLTYPTYKSLYDLINAVKGSLEPCKPQPALLNQSWIAVRT